MPDSLVALEQQRAAILARIVDLGDFRSGSITAISGRCGKAECRCHQPNQPGHGPNYRLTHKVNGKTVSETFASPAEQRKAQREVEAFHRFRELSRQLLEVNERICRARPLEDTLSAQEKKGRSDPARSAREIATLLEVVFTGLHKSGRFDLEAVEMAVRAAAHQLGAKMLEELVNAPADPARIVPCICGQEARFHQMRPKQVITAVGEVRIERPYYLCPHCHQGQSPRDAELDVAATEYSPGVRRMMAVVGSETSFQHGREQLELLAGLEVTTNGRRAAGRSHRRRYRRARAGPVC